MTTTTTTMAIAMRTASNDETNTRKSHRDEDIVLKSMRIDCCACVRVCLVVCTICMCVSVCVYMCVHCDWHWVVWHFVNSMNELLPSSFTFATPHPSAAHHSRHIFKINFASTPRTNQFFTVVRFKYYSRLPLFRTCTAASLADDAKLYQSDSFPSLFRAVLLTTKQADMCDVCRGLEVKAIGGWAKSRQRERKEEKKKPGTKYKTSIAMPVATFAKQTNFENIAFGTLAK